MCGWEIDTAIPACKSDRNVGSLKIRSDKSLLFVQLSGLNANVVCVFCRTIMGFERAKLSADEAEGRIDIRYESVQERAGQREEAQMPESTNEKVTRVGLEFPTRVSINITRRCNLNCTHCLSSSGHADPDELSREELFELVDQLKEAGKPTLAIGGVEPLMRKDLFAVMARARKNGVPVSIVTNGIFVNERIAKRLNDLELASITVSVDGLKKNHELIRGAGSFEKTIRGIETLRKWLATAKLGIRVTVNTQNVGECPELIRLAEQLGIHSIRLTPALPLGRALVNDHLLLNQEQYLRFLADCHNVTTTIDVVLPDDKPDPRTHKPGEFGRHCGREVCWITQIGDVYPCIFYGDKYLAGNIREATFVDLWNRCREMSRFSGNEYCNNCAIYEDCRGGCRCRALWQYGDINAVDPYCPLGKNKEHESTVPGHRIPVRQNR